MARADQGAEARVLAELAKIDVVAICADLIKVQSHREHPGHETPCAQHIKALLAAGWNRGASAEGARRPLQRRRHAQGQRQRTGAHV